MHGCRKSVKMKKQHVDARAADRTALACSWTWVASVTKTLMSAWNEGDRQTRRINRYTTAVVLLAHCTASVLCVISVIVGCPGTQSVKLFAKVSFSVQIEGKGLENNFGRSVKKSDKKNPKMAVNFQLFIALPLITFVLLNINSWSWFLYIRLHVWIIE